MSHSQVQPITIIQIVFFYNASISYIFMINLKVFGNGGFRWVELTKDNYGQRSNMSFYYQVFLSLLSCLDFNALPYIQYS